MDRNADYYCFFIGTSNTVLHSIVMDELACVSVCDAALSIEVSFVFADVDE